MVMLLDWITDDDENSPLLGASNPYYPGIMKAGSLVYDGPLLGASNPYYPGIM